MSIGNMTPRYCFLDLEVDRVTKEEGEPSPCITQIAIFDPSREEGQQIFNSYVQPPVELAKQPTENDYSENSKQPVRRLFKDVWPDAIKWMNKGLDGNRKVIVIGHNIIKYDKEVVLEPELKRIGSRIPSFWKFYDTLFLANALRIPGEKTLTNLCHGFGVEVRQAHDAIEDVKMTHDLFMKIIGGQKYLNKVLKAATEFHAYKETINVMKPVDLSKLKAREISSGGAKVINDDTKMELIIMDFEATGLFPEKGTKGQNPRVVQYAFHIPSVDKTFDQLVNPEMKIPRESSAIHGIYDEDVKDALKFDAVWLQGEEFKKTHLGDMANKVEVYVGHNLWGYDKPLEKAERERKGLPKMGDNHKSFDTLALARNRFKGIKGLPRSGFFKQEFLAPLLGINFAGAHDAKNDVLATYELFKKMLEGVDEKDMTKTILGPHPVVDTGELSQVFNGEHYFELYKTACALTENLAKWRFEGIENPKFYELKNLCAVLDINYVATENLFMQWRVFLLLTEGVDRKEVNVALQTEEPLESLKALCVKSSTFDAEEIKKRTKFACGLVVPLAKVLFPDQKDSFYKPEKLAELLQINYDDEIDAFDLKRLFLKLTMGVQKTALYQALTSPDAAREIGRMVEERGTFYPANYVKKTKAVISNNNNNSSSSKTNSVFNSFFEKKPKEGQEMKVDIKSPSLKRERDEQESMLSNDAEKDSQNHKKVKLES